MIQNHLSKSVEETFAIAQAFSKTLKGGDSVAFSGGLGAGKTVFIKGIGMGLEIADANEIKSPTFAIMHVYEAKYTMYHYDLYRLEKESDLEAIGIEEFLEDPKAICCIEWSERAESILPVPTYRITIETIDEQTRKIKVEKNV